MLTLTPLTCIKCGAEKGGNWKQCKGSCPIPSSPHFDPNVGIEARAAKVIAEGPRAALQRLRECAMTLVYEMEAMPFTVALGPTVESNLTQALLRVVEVCEKREAELTLKVVT